MSEKAGSDDPMQKKEPEIAEEVVEPQAPSAVTVDISTMKPRTLKLASKLGIPLDKIVAWAQFQEQRMNRIEEYLKKTLPEDMKKAFTSGLQTTMAQGQKATPIPQGGGGGMMNLIASLAPMLTGGGGDDPLRKLAMNALTSQISMSSAITNAVVAKITGKATSEVAKAITDEK